VLQELVRYGEDQSVGGGDSQLGTARGQGHKDTRSQNEEEKRSRQDVGPHFC